eukprot:Em0001g293a
MAGRKKTDILFVGRKGIGKSHLITALTNDIDKTKAADEHSWRLQEVDTSPAAENEKVTPKLVSAGRSDNYLPDGRWIQNLKKSIHEKLTESKREKVTMRSNLERAAETAEKVDQCIQIVDEGVNTGLETPVLSISDLQEVRCEVGNVAPKWQFLGQILGIHPDDLAKIECNSSKAERCLNEVLKMWLKQGYDTKRYPLPTRSVLCRAVANNNGGCDRALAIKIATKHRYDVLKNSL